MTSPAMGGSATPVQPSMLVEMASSGRSSESALRRSLNFEAVRVAASSRTVAANRQDNTFMTWPSSAQHGAQPPGCSPQNAEARHENQPPRERMVETQSKLLVVVRQDRCPRYPTH